MDGFFVAKLQKFSNSIPDGVEEAEAVEEPEEEIEVPKNAKKNDWFYKDALDKKKDQKKDSKYEETVFEKPVKKKGQKKEKKQENGGETSVEPKKPQKTQETPENQKKPIEKPDKPEKPQVGNKKNQMGKNKFQKKSGINPKIAGSKMKKLKLKKKK
jgi:hypothetical protein